MRLVEIRLLEGPNLYALGPIVKVEVAVGRASGWAGDRRAVVSSARRLGDRIPRAEWPPGVVALVAWLRRLRRELGEPAAGITVHRAAQRGRWIVAFEWTGAERARAVAETAFALARRGVPASPAASLEPGQARLVASSVRVIGSAGATPPAWIRDAERTMPIVSVSGTNGKSTVTRLVTHILAIAGRRVGTTTSDGVYVDERLVDAGDWTGPAGAAQVLKRGDVDVAVLETARGGILLRGIGYESNDVGVLTNVSSDHLDLQGIHTLAQLAEVKATICRITRPSGRVVLNADDPLVRAIARRCRAPVALFTLGPGTTGPVARHLEHGGLAYAVRDGRLVELEGGEVRRIVEVRRIPTALGGLATYNIANTLAAAAAARGVGAPLEDVASGLADFRPSAALSPGRLNLFRLGSTLVVIDFAHNEAGVAAILGVAEGLAAGASGPSGEAAAITAIVGTAGDRPDHALRAIGRLAGERAQRVVIKETLHYLRGRPREAVVRELLAGLAEAGRDPELVPVHESETAALRAELGGGSGGVDRPERVIVLLCHEERDGVLALLERLGARPVDAAAELERLVSGTRGLAADA